MQPLFRLPSTPVFEHVRPYRRIRDEVRRYLRSNLLVVDDGLEERVKSTSRLYEQWVFFQLAAAFRKLGLRARPTRECCAARICSASRSRWTAAPGCCS